MRLKSFSQGENKGDEIIKKNCIKSKLLQLMA